jgi:formylglycine-generating enzyme required for sulfatase activity
VDSDPATTSQLAYKAVPLGRVLTNLEGSGAQLNLLILDCCRDNPLPTRGRNVGGTRGLAPLANAPKGTFIAYAADASQQAWDDHGEIGLYGTVLYDKMRTPGLRLEDIFIQTREEVSRLATQKYQHQQEPAEYSKISGAFYFVPGGPGGLVMPSPQPAQDQDYVLLAGRSAGERRMVEVAPGVSIPFRWCPAGSFTMGSPASEQSAVKASGFKFDVSDEVQHRVTFSKGFWMAETEVTQGQWQAVMKTSLVEQARAAILDDTIYQLGGKQQTWRDWAGATKQSDPASRVGAQSEKIAMYFINHFEAEEWCEKASRHAGLRGWAVALPTEAQWEYACRAGTGGMTYAGDFSIKGQNNAPGLDGIAWYGGNSSVGYSGTGWDTASWPEKQYPGGHAGPRRVGTKSANEWGLHDMLGNVWEWCVDWYGSYTGDATDPRGPASGVFRVNRGGSWSLDAAYCRAASRGSGEPGFRFSALGFRPALVPSR